MGQSVLDMQDWENKQRLSLLVTDSGLGGLSICAGIVSRLADACMFGDLSVVYFNAWPMQDRGYNYLDDDAMRVRVFSNAISAMNRYRPDLILIACNTLSVVFKKGGLSAATPSPVVDIINFGVEMIAEKLQDHPKSTVLLLGTRTTMASGVYKKQLTDRGVAESRIFQQDCHGLAGAIERNPQSPEVQSLVERFMTQAASVLPSDTKQIHIALCCTHYDYSRSLIEDCLSRHTRARIETINPNQGMIDFVTGKPSGKRVKSVNLDIKVVSRVHLPLRKISSIAMQIEAISPKTAQALRNYKHIPDLFDIR